MTDVQRHAVELLRSAIRAVHDSGMKLYSIDHGGHFCAEVGTDIEHAMTRAGVADFVGPYVYQDIGNALPDYWFDDTSVAIEK